MVKWFGIKNSIWLDYQAVLIVGRRRTGKSSLLAMICSEALSRGYKVYSNYPIDGALKVPKMRLKDGRFVTDKSFFYNNPDLKDSFLLIDEVMNVWNSRSWGKWTEDDSDFFNFLGKQNCKVFMVTQAYDCVDLNVRRSIDMTWFVRPSLLPHCSIVEMEYHDLCKVEHMESRVLDTRYMQVSYESCVLPYASFRFFRRKYYPLFYTLYTEQAPRRNWDTPAWHDLAFGDAANNGSQS